MYQRTSSFIRGLAGVIAYRWPSPLLSVYGGIGDALLLSAVAHELKRRGCNDFALSTEWPELFQNNPDTPKVVPGDHSFHRVAQLLGLQVIAPFYTPEIGVSGRKLSPKMHIITEMCRSIGISGEVFIKPYYYPLQDELSAVSFAKDSIVIQSSGRSARHHLGNKEWGADKFNDVANLLSRSFKIIQIGSKSDPLLQNAEDLRGRTSLRQTAAILASCSVFVGLVGFLMHLARAVNKRSVIIYGGREKPWQSGYSYNVNIEGHHSCSPCWQDNICEHRRMCLSSITAKTVCEQITRVAISIHCDVKEDQIVIL
ncbi:MAG: glycosyltransferase family 9 protein [Nitrospira sp.]